MQIFADYPEKERERERNRRLYRSIDALNSPSGACSNIGGHRSNVRCIYLLSQKLGNKSKNREKESTVNISPLFSFSRVVSDVRSSISLSFPSSNVSPSFPLSLFLLFSLSNSRRAAASDLLVIQNLKTLVALPVLLDAHLKPPHPLTSFPIPLTISCKTIPRLRNSRACSSAPRARSTSAAFR